MDNRPPDLRKSNQIPHVHRYEPKGTGQLSRWAECECREKLAGENGPIVGSLAKITRAIEEAKC